MNKVVIVLFVAIAVAISKEISGNRLFINNREYTIKGLEENKITNPEGRKANSVPSAPNSSYTLSEKITGNSLFINNKQFTVKKLDEHENTEYSEVRNANSDQSTPNSSSSYTVFQTESNIPEEENIGHDVITRDTSQGKEVKVTPSNPESDKKPLSDEDHEKLHKLNLECAKTSGVDEETLKKIEEDVEYPETDEMKEHAKCFMTGLGVMDDEGKIDAEVMATSLKMVVSDGQATGIAEKCNVEKDSAKETAWEMGRCVQTELHALGV